MFFVITLRQIKGGNGKPPRNGGFNGNIIYTWAMFVYQRLIICSHHSPIILIDRDELNCRLIDHNTVAPW